MSRVGDLVIPAAETNISLATRIPTEGKKWFKGTSLDLGECRKFFKNVYQGVQLSTGVPRACINKDDDEFLKVIQRYFTCEGRLNMVYAYHVRLLMHFEGVKVLNIPYFLHMSLGKMSDKIQSNPKSFSSHLFQCGLIRLLIVKELAKRRRTRGSFLEKLCYHPITLVSLKERETPYSEKRRVDNTPDKKIQREYVKKEMPVAATEPSKVELALAKRKVRKLVFNLEKDNQKSCVKPILILVEDEGPKEIQENSGK